MPTVETSLRMNDKNLVDSTYYEKPTTTNTTIRLESAMNENPKVQCSSNDLVRRLMNTKKELPDTYMATVVDTTDEQ